MRWASFVVGAGVCLIATVVMTLSFGNLGMRRMAAQIDRLEHERRELITFTQRLTASRRVAQVEVLKQETDPAGRVRTMLLWQELGPDALIGKPIALEVFGRQVYFEAMVIKFDPKQLAGDDGDRGHSLHLFRRVFGDQQSPEAGSELGKVARPLMGPGDPNAMAHAALWERFWELMESPAESRRMGIRTVQLEAPAVAVKPGQVWEVTLDAAGGLNVRLLQERTDPS